MDQKKLLEEVRQGIIRSAGQLRLETLRIETKKLNSYVLILQALSELIMHTESTEYSDAESEGVTETKDEINHVYTGIFKRELTGGTIGSFKVFVPESVVRNQRLQEGDFVRAKGLKSIVLRNGNIRTLYDYSAIKRVSEPLPTSRRELNFICVQFDEQLGLFYIDVQDEVENYDRLVLAERDVKQLEISQGDWIDYAYFENEPSAGRVIWKHKLGYQLQDAVNSVEAPSLVEGTSFFRDRTLIVVGTMQDALPVQEAIEEYGGEIGFLSGDERFDTMERVAQTGDELIVIVDSIAPYGMKKIRDIGEKLELPMLFIRDMEVNCFLATVMKSKPEKLAPTDEMEDLN